MINNSVQLSIIIPAYNESTKIQRDIAGAANFLESNQISGEIIIVDDGSSDNTAQSAQETPLQRSIDLVVIQHGSNRGKGRAIKRGVAAAHGEIIMFSDSGSCFPYSCALAGISLIRSGKCEIAHGSRYLPQSVIHQPQNLSRRIKSRIFLKLADIYLNLPGRYTDTQCGFKLYRGDIAKELFAQSVISGYLFDIEIMLRALHKGYRIEEFPVNCTIDPDSRMLPLSMAWKILRDLRWIKKSAKKLKKNNSAARVNIALK